jgi:hypothetical protein
VCIHHGMVLAYDLLNAVGYNQITSELPSYQAAAEVYLELTAPPTAQVQACKQHRWLQEAALHGEAHLVGSEKRPDQLMDAIRRKAWYSGLMHDLSDFTDACAAVKRPLLHGSLTAAIMDPEAEPAFADMCTALPTRTGACISTGKGFVPVSQVVRVCANQHISKQSRNMLERFRQHGLYTVINGLVKDMHAYNNSEDVRVGNNVLASSGSAEAKSAGKYTT